MRAAIMDRGIKLILLFLVLFFLSCHSNNKKIEDKKYHRDTVVIHRMRFDPAILSVNKNYYCNIHPSMKGKIIVR